jgi:hypothetical protein
VTKLLFPNQNYLHTVDLQIYFATQMDYKRTSEISMTLIWFIYFGYWLLWKQLPLATFWFIFLEQGQN